MKSIMGRGNSTYTYWVSISIGAKSDYWIMFSQHSPDAFEYLPEISMPLVRAMPNKTLSIWLASLLSSRTMSLNDLVGAQYRNRYCLHVRQKTTVMYVFDSLTIYKKVLVLKALKSSWKTKTLVLRPGGSYLEISLPRWTPEKSEDLRLDHSNRFLIILACL